MPLDFSNPKVSLPGATPDTPGMSLDLSSPTASIAHIPPHCTATPGLHFHATHVEHLVVKRGAIDVRIDTHLFVATPATGKIVIPRYARHDIRLHQTPDSMAEGATVEESTDPADGSKSMFFWAIGGAIQDLGTTNLMGGVRVVKVCWECDSYHIFLDLQGITHDETKEGAAPVKDAGPGALISVKRGVEYVMTNALMGFAAGIGALMGVETIGPRTVPENLWKEHLERKKAGQPV